MISCEFFEVSCLAQEKKSSLVFSSLLLSSLLFSCLLLSFLLFSCLLFSCLLFSSLNSRTEEHLLSEFFSRRKPSFLETIISFLFVFFSTQRLGFLDQKRALLFFERFLKQAEEEQHHFFSLSGSWNKQRTAPFIFFEFLKQAVFETSRRRAVLFFCSSVQKRTIFFSSRTSFVLSNKSLVFMNATE